MQVIEIETFAAVNPFAADIAQLAEMTEGNPKAAGQFVATLADAGKTKFKISKAANDADLTAALVSEVPELDSKGKETGNVTLTYRLKARHQSKPRGPRTPKATSETEEATAE